MATFALNRPDVFPEGTTVKAFKRSNYPQSQRPPSADVGTPDDSKLVLNGAAAFTTLADDTAYYATATVAGKYRAISFRTSPAPDLVTWSEISDSVRTRGWLPDGAIVSNMLWYAASAEGLGITSGTLRLVGGLVLPAGRKISSVTFVSGNAAAGTPTNQWAALYDRATLARLAVSADDGANAWPTRSPKTFTFTTPYTPVADQEVYAGLLIAATTPPNLTGNNLVGGISGATGIAPFKAAQSTSGLTAPPGPDPAGPLTPSTGQPFCYVS